MIKFLAHTNADKIEIYSDLTSIKSRIDHFTRIVVLGNDYMQTANSIGKDILQKYKWRYHLDVFSFPLSPDDAY
jgi:hypothetical protein